MAVRRTALGLLREHYFAPDYPQNLIQNPETARRLQRFFGLRERMPVQSVAPDVQPVVVVENLTVADPTSTTRRCCFADVVGAVVGDSGCVELQNGDLGSPFNPGLGVDLVLRRIYASTSVAGLIVGLIVNGELGLTPNPRTFMNTGLLDRLAAMTAQPDPSAIVKDGSFTPPLPADGKIFTFLAPAGQSIMIDEPGVILVPGWEFLLFANPTNSIFHYTLWWDERPRTPDRP